MPPARLCRWCKEINFAAILTPRECDEKTGRTTTVFRPEYSGNGQSPSLEWTGFGKTKRSGLPENYLPQIRTAAYDELSVSSNEDQPASASLKGHSDGTNQPPAETENEHRLDQFNDGGGGDESDGSSDESVSTWSDTSHFTEIQRIDLDKQRQGNWDYRHGHLYHLGSIWDVRSRRRECDFCRRLWMQTRKNPDVKSQYLTKSRCILKLMELKGRRSNQPDKEVILLNLVYIYGYKVDEPRGGGWLVRTPLVFQGVHRDVLSLHEQIPAGQALPFDDNLFGEARWRNGECNYGLFREWLKTCETKHDHPLSDATGDMAIRLIDVQRKCLVQWRGLASEVPRFVALSYVWGKSEQEVLLTKDRLPEFEQPGSLDRRLNRTIKEALDVVARIGETFIWIDALCILQDSPEDKMVQIPQMHQIYSKAILTIVAAHGDSADAGLPGVTPQSRSGNRFSLDLQDIRVLIRSHTKMRIAQDSLDIVFTENYLRSSTYLSRAWTFQEGHLSTRVLVFTTDQVYFECDRCTWCEETHWESDSMDFTSWRAIRDPTPFDVWVDRVDRAAYDQVDPDEDTSEPPRNSYATLIRNYSQRNLTHDTDILDACTGVLSMIKQRERSDFFFGLRTRFFGNDLLFNILRRAPRRFPDEEERNAGSHARFPTWSWAAWKGPIEIANEARNNSYDVVENIEPCDGVKCYRIRVDPRGKKSLEVINENGGWRFEKDYVRTGGGICDPIQPHDPTAGSPVHEAGDDISNIAETAVVSTEDVNGAAEIPTYSQDLSLPSISSYPAFSQVLPEFHIIFATFSCLVAVRTKCDGEGLDPMMWVNPGSIEREVYVCWKKSVTDPEPGATKLSCPSCGSDTCPGRPLPQSLEQGPCIGHLPRNSGPLVMGCQLRYAETIPDGVYKLLWMNNNQLPMFGHLLCKPASTSALEDGSDWDGEILQRVSGMMGPTQILERQQQEKYGVEWGIHILG